MLYREKSEENKEKTKNMLDLLNAIRVYEDNTFEKRYEAINFRYKGKVDFNFFT